MSHKRLVTVLRRLRIGHVAIGLAALGAVVPPSFAHGSGLQGQGESTGTATESQGREARDELSAGLTTEAAEQMGVSVDVPIGKIWVGPEVVEGESSYVRRTVRAGMTIVEVSTTPFMPDLEAGDGPAGILRPAEQPAGW